MPRHARRSPGERFDFPRDEPAVLLATADAVGVAVAVAVAGVACAALVASGCGPSTLPGVVPPGAEHPPSSVKVRHHSTAQYARSFNALALPATPPPRILHTSIPRLPLPSVDSGKMNSLAVMILETAKSETRRPARMVGRRRELLPLLFCRDSDLKPPSSPSLTSSSSNTGASAFQRLATFNGARRECRPELDSRRPSRPPV